MNYHLKLFDIFSWITPWMVEALITILGALILVFVICKANDCFNGEQQ
jgi:hypothetical protein